jgi:hypothetical protein
MVDEQRGPVVASGTPRVQGYPTPHERHGRQRGQAVKAAQHPKGLAFTAWLRWRTLANKEGWGSDRVGAPRLGHGAQRRAGCWGCLPGDAPASRAKECGTGTALANATAPQRRAGGSPLGGRTGLTRRGPKAQSAWPHRVGGGQHVRLRGTRLTRSLCGFGAADTALAMDVGAKPCATPRERWAWRAGRRGARHNGGCVGRGHQANLVGDWPRYMQQPVMLNGATRHSPRSPAQDGPGSMPGLACTPRPAQVRLALTSSSAGQALTRPRPRLPHLPTPAAAPCLHPPGLGHPPPWPAPTGSGVWPGALRSACQ